MKTKILTLLAAGLAWGNETSAQVEQAWVARFSASGSFGSRPYALAVDNAGDVYVAGNSGFSRTDNDYDNDYAIVKYDPNGNQLWSTVYDNAGSDDYAVALALDTLGNVYVTGSTFTVSGAF